MEIRKMNKLTKDKDITPDSNIPSAIVLTDRKNANITGILELYSSGETEIKAKTSLGNLKITGQNLKPERLDLDAKVLDVSGEIESLSYYGTSAGKSWLKRIFK